jgi:nucleotide-binding universal stress UspA family protein
MPSRIAYLSLITYPEAAPDQAILAAVHYARMVAATLRVEVLSVDIPPVATTFGGYLMNVDGMVRAAEDRSKAEADRLRGLVIAAGVAEADVAIRQTLLGATAEGAAVRARYCDMTVLPWAEATVAVQDMAQALIFGTGLPVVLVPATSKPKSLTHIALAWDESAAAARALNAALPLLAEGGQVSVLTVRGEKTLSEQGLAEKMAQSLGRRGYRAVARDVTLDGRSIADALQGAATEAGAQMLAMGGFGHSRLRDFILGGATKGVLADLQMPVLMSH